MAGPATTRKDAQRRVDRIQAFREELAEPERDHVLVLSSEDRARVETHQDAIVARFAHEYDVDVQAGQRQLSIGMRLASAFGALALSARGTSQASSASSPWRPSSSICPRSATCSTSCRR